MFPCDLCLFHGGKYMDSLPLPLPLWNICDGSSQTHSCHSGLLMTFSVVLSLYFFSNLFLSYTPLALMHQVAVKLCRRNCTIYFRTAGVISEVKKKKQCHIVTCLKSGCSTWLCTIPWLCPDSIPFIAFKEEQVHERKRMTAWGGIALTWLNNTQETAHVTHCSF